MEFVARIVEAKYMKYVTYRLTVPINIVKALDLAPGDYVACKIKKIKRKEKKGADAAPLASQARCGP
jgi:acetamidase/formamidase